MSRAAVAHSRIRETGLTAAPVTASRITVAASRNPCITATQRDGALLAVATTGAALHGGPFSPSVAALASLGAEGGAWGLLQA